VFLWPRRSIQMDAIVDWPKVALYHAKRPRVGPRRVGRPPWAVGLPGHWFTSRGIAFRIKGS
jgi:hypothetical protein